VLSTYHDIFLARAQAAVGAARSVSSVGQAALKGQLQEIVMRGLLRPLLPQGIGIGSGLIISSDGETSTQQDIILFDADVAPPAVFEGEIGIFPVESVLFVVEVKSRLSATDVRNANEAAECLSKLTHAPPLGQDAWTAGDHVEGCIPVLFAFDSDLTEHGRTEVERYDSLLVAITNAYSRVLATRHRPDLAAYLAKKGGVPRRPIVRCSRRGPKAFLWCGCRRTGGARPMRCP
jgi:hypothetical protein